MSIEWFLHDGDSARQNVMNNLGSCFFILRSRQISLLILSKFKRVNQLLLPRKSSENRRFYDSFRRKQKLIRLNSLNIKSEIWSQTLTWLLMQHYQFCLTNISSI